jgi:hypothetical protein
MKTRCDLTQAQVRELFDYNPETGQLIWKVERYRKHPGDIAGCAHKTKNKNYWRVSVSVNYRRYLAHRIIWLWMTGDWPEQEIDHIDRNATHNQWSNLRLSGHSENGRNLSVKTTSKTGIAGVLIDKRRGDYRARIMVNRRDIYLGNFKTIEEAIQHRRMAELKYFGRFAPNAKIQDY